VQHAFGDRPPAADAGIRPDVLAIRCHHAVGDFETVEALGRELLRDGKTVAQREAAGDNVDWFPDGVPVVVGQLDGGEGRPTDTGLRVESDRLLVRVVGWGGRP